MCPVPEGYCVVQGISIAELLHLSLKSMSHSRGMQSTSSTDSSTRLPSEAQGIHSKHSARQQPRWRWGNKLLSSSPLWASSLLTSTLRFQRLENSSSSGLEEEDRHGDSKGKIFSWAWALRKHSAMIPFHQSRLTFSADLYLSKFGIQLGKRCRWSFSHGWGFLKVFGFDLLVSRRSGHQSQCLNKGTHLVHIASWFL